MQPVSTATLDVLERSVAVEIFSRVYAEWEQNGFFESTVTGSAASDPNFFPIESVVEPRRPVRSGLPKAIVNQSRVVNLESSFIKYRVPSSDAQYKYFHTNATTDGIGAFSSPQTVQVVYDAPMPCNKIVVGFEISFAAPIDTTIEVLTGGTWTSIGAYAPSAEGRAEAYLQSNGSWSSVLTRENPVNIDGVRISVSNMDTANAGLAVIQVSPRFMLDMTDRVSSVAISRAREDFEQTNPVASASSATATINFANDDGYFDAENTSSPINGLIENNVQFEVIDVIVDPQGVSEGVPAGTFFADSWSVSDGIEASVQATDRSKFLQETVIENCFYQFLAAEDVVQEIIERFGHPWHSIRYTTTDASRRIPYTFFRDDQTYWDALVSLALAEQAAFYFDEQDRFVWESRDYIWENNTASLQLRDVADGSNLPNLVSFEPRYDLAANKVTVNYTPLEPVTSQGQVVNNVVWEESNTTVLWSSPVLQNVLTGSTTIVIDSKRSSTDDDDSRWDFFADEGIVNLNGEYMRYTKSTVRGRLNITERGLFNSKIANHYINPADNGFNFYTLVWSDLNQNYSKYTQNGVFGRKTVRDSYVQLEPGWFNNHHRTLIQYTGGTLFDRYAAYGTELVFPSSLNADPWTGGEVPFYDGVGLGGLVVHHNEVDRGYYFELMTSQEARSWNPPKAEVRVWRLNDNPVGWPWMGDNDNPEVWPPSGKAFNIIPGKRHRLEVLYSADTQGFNVFVDGTWVMDFVDTGPGTPPSRGKWGVFVRDNSLVRFEHVWAFNNDLRHDDLPPLRDAFTDRVTGGFQSGTLEAQWTNGRLSDVYFEDFGPWVHEVKEYEVDYEIAPNIASALFMSNDQDTYQVLHKYDPFSSHFAVSSRSRDPVVLVGSDPGRDNTQMSMFVYGRPIIEGSESSISRKDNLSIRRRGMQEYNLESPWVQTQERAERIADWIVQRWGETNDVVEAKVFMFPPLQVGDLVEINTPGDNRLPATHKYHVLQIEKTVGVNPSMSLTLRRKR